MYDTFHVQKKGQHARRRVVKDLPFLCSAVVARTRATRKHFLLKPRGMDSVGVSGGPENSAGGMLHSDEKFVLNGLY